MIRQNDFLIVKAVDEVEIYALQWTNVVDADFLVDLTEDRFVGGFIFHEMPADESVHVGFVLWK